MHRAAALVTAALAAIGAFTAGGAPAAAAEAAPAAVQQTVTIATGHDVSYPQCGEALPTRSDIAVVGVNAGTGTTTNPCLADQLAWGDAPAADGTERLADVYVNTANPGHLGGWWPRSDLTRTGLPVTNPEGACIGAEDAACAYVYGWSIAADDALRRGVTRPGERTWWLDVETMNTWSWNRAANLAVLEGMADAFRQVGGRVGVYSTGRQWGLIVGSAAPSSGLAGAPSWIAGAITRGGAEENCAAARSFTPGGRVVMAQWVQGDQDHDVSCVPGVAGSAPRVGGDAVAGGRLVAQPGRWGPVGVRLSYQWLRNGLPVEGATGAAYAPVAIDAGAELAVRVTGSRLGAPSLVLTSPAVAVGAARAAASPAPGAAVVPQTDAPVPAPSASAPAAEQPDTAPAPSAGPTASAPASPAGEGALFGV